MFDRVRRPLPRAFAAKLAAEDAEKLEKILRTVGERIEPASTAGATAPGDGRRLRGIPVVGRSTAGGAIPGSDPVQGIAREGTLAGPLDGDGPCR